MSQKQMHLNQCLSKDHLSALVASSLMSLVAAAHVKRGSGGNTPRKIFDSVHFTLAYNASLNIMLAICGKDLKFCGICFLQEAPLT